MDVRAELNCAIDICHSTGEILLSYFNTDKVDTRAKGSRDVVTAADMASEEYVIHRLRESFPGDGIVAEEGGQVEAHAGRRWYLDPLDGTLNYSRGLPVWCVSLGLLEDNQPTLGVVYDPIRRETFSGARGLGAWCGDDPIHCQGSSRLSDAFMHVTIDFNDESMLEGVDDVRLLAPRVLRMRNLGSAALALAYVAAGRFDAMLHRSAHTWDYAGGVAVIGAAGGVVTDMRGNSFSPQTASMIAAANTSLHRELLGLSLDFMSPG